MENQINILIQKAQNVKTIEDKQKIKKEINQLFIKIYPDKISNDKNYKERCRELFEILKEYKDKLNV